MLSNAAILEISELSSRAETLARGNAADRQQSSVLLARIKQVRLQEMSSLEMAQRYASALVEETTTSASDRVSEERYKKAFHKYIFTGEKGLSPELRADLQAGQQTISYTQGPAGGYLVPLDYERKLFAALAQVDPLLSSTVCSFKTVDSTTLQPQILSGVNLSTLVASQVNEVIQQTTTSFPTVAGRVLRGNIIFKISIAASLESELDIPSVMSKFALSYGVALARKIGGDCINGNGTTQIQGLLTALPTPVYTSLYQDILVHQDLNAIFFSVDRIYRASALCGWLCSDSVYKRIREAADPIGRPLINMENDREVLLGKPIFVCPSLPFCGSVGSPSVASNSQIIFGDLSAYHIRTSRPTLQRVVNGTVADITKGQAEFIGRIRADGALFDPSGGTNPPLVVATIQG